MERYGWFLRGLAAGAMLFALNGEDKTPNVQASQLSGGPSLCSEWYAVSGTGEILFGGPRTVVDKLKFAGSTDMLDAQRPSSRGIGLWTIYDNYDKEEINHVCFCRGNPEDVLSDPDSCLRHQDSP